MVLLNDIYGKKLILLVHNYVELVDLRQICETMILYKVYISPERKLETVRELKGFEKMFYNSHTH